jgi:hypothetical protein
MRAYMIKININKLNEIHPCQHIFREANTIIIIEYNSGSKLRERIDVVFQKIVIGENAELWKLHLLDVGFNMRISNFLCHCIALRCLFIGGSKSCITIYPFHIAYLVL